MVGVETPISLIAKRWTPSTRMVKRAALSAVGMSVFIIVTGGAVRLTGSGLGCDTWPKCTDDSLFATPEQGLHGAIEFGNRMLAYVLSAAVGWAIVATSSMKPRRRKLTRLAWAQFWIVLANAVLGGITVWAGLNPWTVAGHFLLANLLLAVAVITWVRVGEGDGPPRPRTPLPVRRLAWAIVATTVILIVLGTSVTGSGKHAATAATCPACRGTGRPPPTSTPSPPGWSAPWPSRCGWRCGWSTRPPTPGPAPATCCSSCSPRARSATSSTSPTSPSSWSASTCSARPSCGSRCSGWR